MPKSEVGVMQASLTNVLELWRFVDATEEAGA